MDFRKAFDLVDHKILLRKLRCYKCNETCLKWFESYLTHLISSQSLNFGGRRGTTDDVATIPFHPSLSSAALREFPNPIPVHSLMLSLHHNYILVKKRFCSGIKTARTGTFPGADVGKDHDMVMMTFQTSLKNSRKPIQPRIRFDLEKLNAPTVMSATIGGRFAPLATLVDEDADLGSMVTNFNKAVTDTAAELLGKQRRKRKPWVTPEILDLFDQRRDLKKKRGEPE